MTFPTDLIFLAAVPLLFWSLLGIIAPRHLRLPSSWFAASLAGFAFIALYAAVELDPARTRTDYQFPTLVGIWVLVSMAAMVLRVIAAAYLLSTGRQSGETGIVHRLAARWVNRSGRGTQEHDRNER